MHSKSLIECKTSGNTFSHSEVPRFQEAKARVIDLHITPLYSSLYSFIFIFRGLKGVAWLFAMPK